MAMSVVASIACYKFLHDFGFNSREYIYFYYYSDALLTVLLYFALSSLYSHVFSELKTDRYLRMGTIFLLSCTALLSYAVVHQSSSNLVPLFALSLPQTLY